MTITLTGRVSVTADVFTYAAGEALLLGNTVYINTDGKVYKAKADNIATMPGIGITLGAANAGDQVSVLQAGQPATVIRDGNFFANDIIVVSPTSAGSLTNVAPTAVGQFIQIMGIAKDSSSLVLQIDHTVIEVRE